MSDWPGIRFLDASLSAIGAELPYAAAAICVQKVIRGEPEKSNLYLPHFPVLLYDMYSISLMINDPLKTCSPSLDTQMCP